MRNEFVICATRSMREYAVKVTDYLRRYPSFIPRSESIDKTDALRVKKFADGEMEVVVGSSIRGNDIYLFSSSARNPSNIGTEEAKIELYHSIDALKRSQANKITVFEPFVSCSRSDRTNRRNSVGLWVHVKTMISLGVNQMITYQLHSDKSKTIIDPTLAAIDDVPGLILLKKRICDVYISDIETLRNQVRPNWVFCSVDAGGEKLARRFANTFGSHLVIAHKQRDYSKLNSIESINILSATSLKDKVLWVVDDMIDTAASIESLIRALSSHCPSEINIAAVHAVLSKDAPNRLRRLIAEYNLKHIIVTDTVHCPGNLPVEIPGLEIVPSTELSASIIGTIASNRSLSNMFEAFDAEQYLKNSRFV